MHLPPVLASLSRHKLMVFLIVATTALTSAIVSNIAVMFVHRLELISSPSGLAESHLITVESSVVSNSGAAAGASGERLSQYRGDVAQLRGIGALTAAATISGLPFSGGTVVEISGKPAAESGNTLQVAAYGGSPGLLKALGLKLIGGRDFLDSEFVPSDGVESVDQISVAIISSALAKRLFHRSEAVGLIFYCAGHPIRVVGVVDHLMSPNPVLGAPDNEYSMLFPLEPNGSDVIFVASTSAENRGYALRQMTSVLAASDPTRVLSNAKPFSQVRSDYFQGQLSMVRLLGAAGLALLSVTVSGIMGLMSFWVYQRTRSTGIRRALGATRDDILRYYLLENFTVVTCGVLAGCLLAYALNSTLVQYFEAQILPPGYLLVGAIALWSTGQLAGLGPAFRAASVPPAVATRSS